MQSGQLAWIFAIAGSVVVALIGAYATRYGAWITRGTELTKVYMARLKDIEDDNDTLKAVVQAQREQHLMDMSALDEVRALRAELVDLRRKDARPEK